MSFKNDNVSSVSENFVSAAEAMSNLYMNLKDGVDKVISIDDALADMRKVKEE